MLAHLRAKAAVFGRRSGASFRKRLTPIFGAAALSLLLVACSAAPERPLAAADPSDPNTRVPATAYRPVLGGYASQRPVEPAPWREQNERVAPAQRQ